MKRIVIVTLAVLFYFVNTYSTPLIDSNIKKETFIYSIKGSDTLRLDKYNVASIDTLKPCVIFVFGGGFTHGSRNHESNVAYMKQLAQSGYVAIAIDYRLGLKDNNPSTISNPLELINIFENTINIAVEDLFDATNFILNQSNEWNIDRSKIIANGSSAGAITVLQGEYAICNEMNLSKKLPNDFNYAGIISFAGAIFSNTGSLEWAKRPAPIQMFHGNADSNVPYNMIEMFNIGLYGSKHIAEQLDEMKSPYYFYDVDNAGHEIASTPKQDNLEEVSSFINNFVIRKKPLIINTKIEEIGKPEMKKDFEIMDYIKANYM